MVQPLEVEGDREPPFVSWLITRPRPSSCLSSPCQELCMVIRSSNGSHQPTLCFINSWRNWGQLHLLIRIEEALCVRCFALLAFPFSPFQSVSARDVCTCGLPKDKLSQQEFARQNAWVWESPVQIVQPWEGGWKCLMG